ncbi:hypothetical protein P168DRAFT_345118 [Aspergillus campestris IBT 28561]|uniref:Hydrophobin n=1 Tax=Aspergillus campestris (strain IBT 28561) TaxID=1392248 RepID=A0A2I1D1X9_ASPC2|nr:uncharacterized protein P168DRAFT_345118 [Aspergillus campestris IBT 28561]PKY03869.1 hypothetical protein P168DRAFT_345118 [Aspergillus campestris IBT 28561]
MNLLTLLTTLTLTFTITTLAIKDPTPTTLIPSTTALSSSPASSSAPANSEYDTCPPSHRSKQCCTSINGITESIFGEIGKVIPILKDVKVSSSAAFDCKGMNDNDSHDQCLTDVMCCDGVSNNLDPKTYKMHCKPYDKAIKDKAKSEKQSHDHPLADALANASSANDYWNDNEASSTPVSTPLSGQGRTPGVGSAAAAAATPTPGED